MNAINQIAAHLQIEVYRIKRCEEWVKVWFVVIQGKGARFVSKKIVGQVKETITSLIGDAHCRYLDKEQDACNKAYEYALRIGDCDVTCGKATLPSRLSKTKIIEYILSAWEVNPFKTKVALKKAIADAAQAGILDYAGKGKFQVYYHGYGNSYSYAATSGTRPICFDNFSRESLDNWIASLLLDGK